MSSYTPAQKKAIYNYREKHRDHILEQTRIYYAERCEDLDFLAKERERNRNRCKQKYNEDPEFREKKNAKRRELYYKKKLHKASSACFTEQQTTHALNEMPVAISVTA